ASFSTRRRTAYSRVLVCKAILLPAASFNMRFGDGNRQPVQKANQGGVAFENRSVDGRRRSQRVVQNRMCDLALLIAEKLAHGKRFFVKGAAGSIYPIARQLGFTVMPSNQVLRRSGQTRNQYNGSMKDQQAHMGHVAGSAVTNGFTTKPIWMDCGRWCSGT